MKVIKQLIKKTPHNNSIQIKCFVIFVFLLHVCISSDTRAIIALIVITQLPQDEWVAIIFTYDINLHVRIAVYTDCLGDIFLSIIGIFLDEVLPVNSDV